MCHDAPMARPRLDFERLLQDPFGELKRTRQAGWLASSEAGPPIALSYDGVRELLSDGRLHANFPDFLPALRGHVGAVLRVDGDLAAQPRRRRPRALACAHVAHLHAAERRAPAAVPRATRRTS